MLHPTEAWKGIYVTGKCSWIAETVLYYRPVPQPPISTRIRGATQRKQVLIRTYRQGQSKRGSPSSSRRGASRELKHDHWRLISPQIYSSSTTAFFLPLYDVSLSNHDVKEADLPLLRRRLFVAGRVRGCLLSATILRSFSFNFSFNLGCVFSFLDWRLFGGSFATTGFGRLRLLFTLVLIFDCSFLAPRLLRRGSLLFIVLSFSLDSGLLTPGLLWCRSFVFILVLVLGRTTSLPLGFRRLTSIVLVRILTSLLLRGLDLDAEALLPWTVALDVLDRGLVTAERSKSTNTYTSPVLIGHMAIR
jgi:hypothetical protein